MPEEWKTESIIKPNQIKLKMYTHGQRQGDGRAIEQERTRKRVNE